MNSGGVWPYQPARKPRPEAPSPLKAFRRSHSIFCDCHECNHEKQTATEREQERRYLNGL